MSRKSLLAMLAVAVLACGKGQVISAETAKTDNPLLGTWRGTSTCTPFRPACHDEIAVYHIAASQKPNTVAVTGRKVVDGREVAMGPEPLEFHVDWATRTLTYEIEARDGKNVFSFTWSRDKMTGTLSHLPGREVIRNIALTKSR